MKMLLLKLCMRSLITLSHQRKVWAAQVSVSVCPPVTSGCHHPLAVCIFSACADLTCAPVSQRRLLQSGRMASHSPVISQPLSTLQKPGLFLFSLNAGPMGVGRAILCVVWCLSPHEVSYQMTHWLNRHITAEMVRKTVTTDPLQEIEVDLPQVGFGEESFPHREEI